MKRHSLPLLLILILTGTTAARSSEIRCPAEPPLVERLQLQERWRIDPDDPDSPLLGFCDQSQVLAHEGRIFLLDRQLCHVLVYDDEGRHLDTIMREGDGPGEVRMPGVLFACADGRLAVQHGYPTKLEFVAPDGTPQGRWTLRTNAWANRILETPRGWFCVYTESKESDRPGVFVSVFHAALHDDAGVRTEDFHEERLERGSRKGAASDEAEEHQPWYTAVAVAGDEVVLAARRDEYRLEWRNLAGETTRVVTRDYPAHRRTEAELEELKYSSYTIVNGELAFPDRRLCSHDPVIRTLEPQPDGSLRLRTSLFEKDMPEGMVCRYEVHAPGGELLKRVEIYDPAGDYDVDYDVIALVDDGRAMVLRNLRPAFRAATDAGLHPERRAKLPPIPDERKDVAFTPIMCDLVPVK